MRKVDLGLHCRDGLNDVASAMWEKYQVQASFW